MQWLSPGDQGSTRILILGGGFAGVYAGYELQRTLRGLDADLAMVSRENSFVYYPLLPEIVSGAIETESILNPIRQVVPRSTLYVGEITDIDLDRHCVEIYHGLYGYQQKQRTIFYDHVVLALGGIPNTEPVPGLSEHGFDVQRLSNAFALRNHLIDTLEQADIETNPEVKRRLLTYVVIGGGATGVEVAAEIWDLFVEAVRYYPNTEVDDLRVVVVQRGDRLIPDFPERLVRYAERTLRDRGIEILFNREVTRVDAFGVALDGEDYIPAETVIGSIGLRPNPLITALPVEHDDRGRIVANPDLTVGERNNVWALGDNASIIDPHTGKPYPQTAQHAVRGAKLVARNISATLRGEPRTPMTYRTRGMMVPLGRRKAIADIRGFTLRGFPAWWIWRTYYLFQLPRWPKRIRVMFDWTAGLLFPPDIVQLKVGQHGPPGRQRRDPSQPRARTGVETSTSPPNL
jgi:NADH:ubiquinone reductase (H+-translocating)